jgi:hypothetical protein
MLTLLNMSLKVLFGPMATIVFLAAERLGAPGDRAPCLFYNTTPYVREL